MVEEGAYDDDTIDTVYGEQEPAPMQELSAESLRIRGCTVLLLQRLEVPGHLVLEGLEACDLLQRARHFYSWRQP